MKLYFENSDGIDSRYELPRDFKPRWSPYKRRKTFKPRYSKDGSVQTGDGRVGSRQISFDYLASSGSGASNTKQAKDDRYRQSMAEIIAFFRPELAPFYLIDTDALLGVGLRCLVDFLQLTDEPEDGATMRVSRNRFDLEMIDGVWEDVDEQSAQDTGGISNGATFSISNSGPLEAYPYFRFYALNQVETITVRNTTNGQFFTYSNTSFGAGTELIVDGRGDDFLVTLDDVNTAYALADGSGPIQLEPGSNTFVFESPSGIVQYESLWRRRYPT